MSQSKYPVRWRTKTGLNRKIENMDDAHLLNAIYMRRRMSRQKKLDHIKQLDYWNGRLESGFFMPTPGQVARVATLDADLKDVEEGTLEQYMLKHDSHYKYLVEEAELRELYIEPSKDWPPELPTREEARRKKQQKRERRERRRQRERERQEHRQRFGVPSPPPLSHQQATALNSLGESGLADEVYATDVIVREPDIEEADPGRFTPVPAGEARRSPNGLTTFINNTSELIYYDFTNGEALNSLTPMRRLSMLLDTLLNPEVYFYIGVNNGHWTRINPGGFGQDDRGVRFLNDTSFQISIETRAPYRKMRTPPPPDPWQPTEFPPEEEYPSFGTLPPLEASSRSRQRRELNDRKPKEEEVIKAHNPSNRKIKL